MAIRRLRGIWEYQPVLYFAGGTFGAALAHGLVASSAVSGSNVPAVLLPLRIGLFERLPKLATQGEEYEDEAYEEEEEWVGYDDPLPALE